ncbi:MAG: hypothetical protein Q3962_05300 [Corynebacterium sp.]|nr:hypothetical protein [Corynebacterium sp.]
MPSRAIAKGPRSKNVEGDGPNAAPPADGKANCAANTPGLYGGNPEAKDAPIFDSAAAAEAASTARQQRPDRRSSSRGGRPTKQRSSGLLNGRDNGVTGRRNAGRNNYAFDANSANTHGATYPQPDLQELVKKIKEREQGSARRSRTTRKKPKEQE